MHANSHTTSWYIELALSGKMNNDWAIKPLEGLIFLKMFATFGIINASDSLLQMSYLVCLCWFTFDILKLKTLETMLTSTCICTFQVFKISLVYHTFSFLKKVISYLSAVHVDVWRKSIVIEHNIKCVNVLKLQIIVSLFCNTHWLYFLIWEGIRCLSFDMLFSLYSNRNIIL